MLSVDDAGPGASVGASTGTTTTATTTSTNTILAEKVARALQVRTDTVAMKAALEALAHMPPGTLDYSRSVRGAIELDALEQARLLQRSLEGRLSKVRELRERVREVADAARDVRDAVHAPVAASSSATVAGPQTTKAVTGDVDASASSSSTAPGSSSSSANSGGGLEREHQLAGQLAEAFENRRAAAQRFRALDEFLSAFYLSPEDQRLLEHYNFEDLPVPRAGGGDAGGGGASATTNMTGAASVHGLAFLRALERLIEIRRELQARHGGGGTAVTLVLSPSSSAAVEPLGTSSALRMMERLATQQERGYERLYHWLQSYLTSGSTAGSSAGASDGGTLVDEGASDALEEALLLLPAADGGGPADDEVGEPGGAVEIHAGADNGRTKVSFVQRALRTLRNVPAFYSHLLELVASSRRTTVTRRFLLALTSGYQGSPPLELQSHDSTLYAGEMLGFCWRSLCVETDIARGLFFTDSVCGLDGDHNDDSIPHHGNKAGGGDENYNYDDDDIRFGSDAPMSAEELLATSMSGLARPLKSRILQIVSSLARKSDATDDDDDAAAGGAASADGGGDNLSDDGLEMEEEGLVQRHRIVHLYEICGLLLFYAGAVDKCLHKVRPAASSSSLTQQSNSVVNPLLSSIQECLDEATRGYEATTRVYAARLEALSALTGDSEAALAGSLVELLATVRVQSPGYSSGIQYPNDECRNLLSMEWCTDTLVRGALSHCRALDHVVVLRQAVAVAKKAGVEKGAVAMERLDEAIDEKETFLIDSVVATETATVLEVCGLSSLATNLQRWREGRAKDDAEDDDDGDPSIALTTAVSMSSHPGLSPDDVEAGIKEFYASLYSPPIPSLEASIRDPLLRRTARAKIARRVVDAYADLYRCIMEEHSSPRSPSGGGYPDVSFLGHTPDQVKTLFSV
jgi:hypothetical protein